MAVTLGLAAAGTAAAMAINAMIAISAISIVAATAIGVTSGVMQSRQAQAQADYQRQVNEQNAKKSREAAQAKIENQRRAAKFTYGTQLARLGGMGALAEGSPLDIMGQSAGQEKYDEMVTEYEGETQAIQFQQQAALNQYQADVADYNLGLNTTATLVKGVGQLSNSILGATSGSLGGESVSYGTLDSGGTIGTTSSGKIYAANSSGLA